MPLPAHIARRLREVLGADAGEDLVTWMDDAYGVRDEIAGVRADLAELRREALADVAELRREVRTDVAELRHEMQIGFTRMEAGVATQIAVLRQSLGEQIADTRSDLMKWSFVFRVGAVAAIAALAGVLRGQDGWDRRAANLHEGREPRFSRSPCGTPRGAS